MICARIETSSADTGSSRTMSSGRDASALARATRWRWPPLNSCGYRRPASGGRPTWSSTSATRLRISAGETERLTIMASAIVSRTRRRGFSDDHGSWKTACTFVRYSRSSGPASACTSRPSSRTRPLVGRSRRSSMRAVVVLPHPDSPTSPTVSFRSIVKLTPSTAFTWPVVRAMSSPFVTGKCLVTSSTRISGSIAWPPPASTRRRGPARR